MKLSVIINDYLFARVSSLFRIYHFKTYVKTNIDIEGTINT